VAGELDGLGLGNWLLQEEAGIRVHVSKLGYSPVLVKGPLSLVSNFCVVSRKGEE